MVLQGYKYKCYIVLQNDKKVITHCTGFLKKTCTMYFTAKGGELPLEHYELTFSVAGSVSTGAAPLPPSIWSTRD